MSGILDEHNSNRPFLLAGAVATFDPATGPLTPEALIHRADQALYHAKHEGRDRAKFFEAA